MPGFDGTGPFGGGPMTGWQRGICVTSGVGFRRVWRGRFAARGAQRGFRNCYWATGVPGWMRFFPAPTREDNIEALKNQAEYLKEDLENLQDYIKTLENNARKKDDA